MFLFGPHHAQFRPCFFFLKKVVRREVPTCDPPAVSQLGLGWDDGGMVTVIHLGERVDWSSLLAWLATSSWRWADICFCWTRIVYCFHAVSPCVSSPLLVVHKMHASLLYLEHLVLWNVPWTCIHYTWIQSCRCSFLEVVDRCLLHVYGV